MCHWVNFCERTVWLSKHSQFKIRSIRDFWISSIRQNPTYQQLLTKYCTSDKYLLSFWNHFPNKSQSKRISFSIEDKFTRYRRIHVNCLCQRKISLRSFAVVLCVWYQLEMKLKFLVWPIIFLGLLICLAESRKRGRDKLPIKDEDDQRHEDKRRKASGMKLETLVVSLG